MIKIKFYTLGCRVNQAETSVLENTFADKGFQVISSNELADILVINTCTVTADGDSDARKLVNKVNRESPGVRIALIGCLAQIRKERLLSWPGVRWVVGTAKKMDLADIINKDLKAEPLVLAPAIVRKPFVMPLSTRLSRRTRANLKIQDGCDNFCAYCEVPFARGRSRSRDFSNILDEAEALVALGHKEIVLTGVNIGLYQNGEQTLLDIIKAFNNIRGLLRIRMSSIELASLPVDTLRYMYPYGKLCRFLHVPLQSGSDRILKRMGRHDTVKSFSLILETFFRNVPGLMIGTDVIAGFPGETDTDHKETLAFLRQAPINYFHVFGYSARERSRSRTFKGELSASVIKYRSHELRQLSQEKQRSFLKGLLGSRETVLVEEKKGDYWIGHSDNYVKIKIRSGMDLRNQMVPVCLDKIEGDSLTGSLIR